MKNLKYIIAMCGLLTVVACTNRENEPAADLSADNWVMSRSADDAAIEDLRMTGKSTGKGKDFSQKITFDTNGNGTWDQKPVWDEGDIFDLIVFYPAGTELPTEIGTDAEYQMQYWPEKNKANRPTTFKLKHLLGQLVVHITVEELHEEHHMPRNVELMLCQRATVNYRNEKAEAIASSAKWQEVTGFKQEQITSDAHDGEMELYKWVMETPVYVIPQTIPADLLGASFWVDDPSFGEAHYEFFPPAPITLAAGKITHLYLGVKYKHEEDEGEGGDGGDTPTFTVTGFEVKVTDWVEGTTNNGNAALQ